MCKEEEEEEEAPDAVCTGCTQTSSARWCLFGREKTEF
jgi:hypothetical protein